MYQDIDPDTLLGDNLSPFLPAIALAGVLTSTTQNSLDTQLGKQPDTVLKLLIRHCCKNYGVEHHGRDVIYGVQRDIVDRKQQTCSLACQSYEVRKRWLQMESGTWAYPGML